MQKQHDIPSYLDRHREYFILSQKDSLTDEELNRLFYLKCHVLGDDYNYWLDKYLKEAKTHRNTFISFCITGAMLLIAIIMLIIVTA